MPLTIAHPAASAPFARLGLPLSALVIGSLTPDFPYFIPIFPANGFSHSLPGLFVFCLPCGLAALALFHSLLKEPLLALLPDQLQSRLSGAASGFSFWPWRRLGQIVLALLWGACTHLVWDAFTHPRGWVVLQFPLFKAPLLVVGATTLPVYTFLQHGSTLVGGLLLVYWSLNWYRQTQPFAAPSGLTLPTSTKIILLSSLSLAALAIGLFSGLATIPVRQIWLSYRLLLGHVFIVSVSVLTLELSCFSLYWQLKLKPKAS